MDKKDRPSILLLGGEGFIGRNLDSYLSYDCQCLSVGEKESLFPGRKGNFLLVNPYEERVDTHYEAAVHLIDNSRCVPGNFLQQEKKLVENISLNSEKHLVLFSSAVVYANPNSEYGIRKKQLEDFYLQYCETNHIPLTIFRLFNTFGSFQIPFRQGSLIANIICNYLNGAVTEIADRLSERDFLYAGDIPKFVEYVLDNDMTGIFDLGSGKLVSLEKVISIIETQVINDSLQIIDKNIQDRIKSPAANNPFLDKIMIKTLPEGLARTVEFYRQHSNLINELYVNRI
jgi:nucleoside-diphosphate-sugar epimerase